MRHGMAFGTLTLLVVVASAVGVFGVSASHAVGSTISLALPSQPPAVDHDAARPHSSLCRDLRADDPLALTRSGNVVVVNPATRTISGMFARHAAVGGGLATAAKFATVYVTGLGHDGNPAIWALGCGRRAKEIASDAELPAVSPDHHALAFVTLDSSGRQSGVEVVSLTKDGTRTGLSKRLPATSVPPPLPIYGLALGPKGNALAVWGGFVDRQLAPGTATTGTLDPRTARTLAALRPIKTVATISIVPSSLSVRPSATTPKASRTDRRPKSGTRAAVYLPNGLMLVGSDVNVGMPWNNRTSGGGHGGGFRLLAGSTGRVDSIAVGPGGAVAWVTADGGLSLTTAAWNFPFGPWASAPYSPPLPSRLGGQFSAVAWTAGRSRTATVAPRVYRPVVMPDVTDLPEPAAVQILDRLNLPSWVTSVVSDPTVPPDTVVSQDVAPGVRMACQCSVGVRVSSGGSPITALMPTGAVGTVRDP